MGVTACGKSTVGKLLAKRLLLPFIEADDFHSEENISKMSHGIPLTDEDRYPWLRSLSHELQQHEKKNGAVMACSALKERYRKILQQGLQEKIIWIYLEGNEALLRQRIATRKQHFMPPELLQSQLATLEKPAYAYTISIEKDPEAIVNEIIRLLAAKK
jgi:carbohydrate kinase (thermoresistant glucokinase family)